MVGSKDLPPSTAPFYPNVFFHNQFCTPPQMPPDGTNLTNHVAIVTGGNSGLGFEAASLLLSYKLSHLVLAVRSSTKGDAAAKELLAQYPKANIRVWIIDMTSYDSIQAFVRRVEKELTRLDMVILNAGLGNFKFRIVPSTGHEEVVQVNYTSTALLTFLLLPSLKAKSPPGRPGRLTIVNSALSLTAKVRNPDSRPFLKAFDDADHFAGQQQYCCSKLLAHMFLWKLVEHVKADDVVVNLVDPGFVKGTDLFARDLPGIARPMMAVFAGLTARNLKVGASTFLDAAMTKGKESHGAFIMSYKIHPFNSLLYTPEGKEAIEALWQETLDEFRFTNVGDILKSMQ